MKLTMVLVLMASLLVACGWEGNPQTQIVTPDASVVDNTPTPDNGQPDLGQPDLTVPDNGIDTTVDDSTDASTDTTPDTATDNNVPDVTIDTDTTEPDVTPDTPEVCVPNCDGHECGLDGCGGSCGSCLAGPCITAIACEEGKCVGTPKVCDDNSNLTDDTCDQETGACVSTTKPGACAKDTDCADGNACTEDVCDSLTSQCKMVEIICDLGNPCVVGKCLPPPIGILGYVCDYEPKSCDDGNSCTTDYCDMDKGCVSDAIPGCCKSDNDCTADAWCNTDDNGGTCWALTCYSDTCGGYYVGNEHRCVQWTEVAGTPCDDGNPDTPKTECDGNGGCVSVPLCINDSDCNDGNPNTTDVCDKTEKAWKCVNTPIPNPNNVCVNWTMTGANFATIYGCVGKYTGGTSFDCDGGWGEWKDRATIQSPTNTVTWCANVPTGEAMLTVVNFGPSVNVNGAHIYWAPAGDGQGHFLIEGDMWYSKNGGYTYDKAVNGNVPICVTGGTETACLLPNGQEGANLMIRSL